MNSNHTSPRAIRFGVFETDLRAEELRKNGTKIRLRGQPFQVLAMLLERPGELVSREGLQQRLWPEGPPGFRPQSERCLTFYSEI